MLTKFALSRNLFICVIVPQIILLTHLAVILYWTIFRC